MTETTSGTTYHSQQLVHVDIRPKRAAYLVHPASERHLRTAIAHASSRWGGIQELIVPSTAGGRIDPAHGQMLEIAAPDVVYGVRALTASGHSEVLSWAGSAPRRVSDELRPDSGTHILDILSEVESAEPTIAAGTSGSTLDHVAHGAFADFNPSESWAFAISSGDSSVDSGTQQFNSRTLIHRTAKRCSFISTTNIAATRVLWVVDEPTVAELRWVWNLRALASISGGSVAIVELSDTRSEGFKAEVHRWVLSQPWQSEPSLIISSWSISKPLLVGLRSRLGLDAHKGGKISQHFGRTGEPVLSAAVNWDPREILMGKTTAGTRVTLNTTLATPSSALRLENPLAFRRPGGRVRLRVTGPDFLDVPRRHQVAELFVRNGTWHAGDLEFETTLNKNYQVDLSIPNSEDVLRATFASGGYEYELSPPGRLGQAILDRLGDDASALLADSTAISMIRAMTTPRAKRIARELVALHPGLDQPDLENAVAQLVGAPMSRASFSLADIAGNLGTRAASLAEQLTLLAKNGLVSRGLHIRCRTCTLETFVDLHSTAEDPRCPACGAAVSYSSNSAGTEPGFTYRLDPLLDRASDQGVLSHLFGLERLRSEYPKMHAIPGVIVKRTGSQWIHEIDVVGFSGQDIFVGEAKYSSAEFTRDQIRRDVRLGQVLGASVQVMVCLEALRQSQIDLFERECSEADLRPLILQAEGDTS